MAGILRMVRATNEYFVARMSMSDRGATAVEYGLIVALIAGIIILVVTALGIDVLNGFNLVEDNLGGSQA